MARNDDVNTVFFPGGFAIETFIGLIGASRVIGGPGGVSEAQSLHAWPKAANEEFGDGCPKSEAAGVGLVAVPHEDVVVEKGGFIDDDAGEQSFEGGGVVPPLQVVVSPYFDIASLLRIRVVKLSQLFINGGVGDVNLVECSIFPHFLRVAQFDVGEAVFQVVVEGAFVYEGIVGKVV